MSDAFITRRGGSALSNNCAVLHIYAEAGSSITLTKGGVTAAALAPSKGHTNNTDTAYADWYYSVPSSNYGSWTVTAAKSGKTASKTVSVSTNEQYDVQVIYKLYIIRNGYMNSSYEIKNNLRNDGFELQYYDNYSATGYVRIPAAGKNSAKATDAIDLTPYTALKATGYKTNANSGYKAAVSVWPSLTRYGDSGQILATSAGIAYFTTASSTISADISTIAGDKYVGVYIDVSNEMYISDMWLE